MPASPSRTRSAKSASRFATAATTPGSISAPRCTARPPARQCALLPDEPESWTRACAGPRHRACRLPRRRSPPVRWHLKPGAIDQLRAPAGLAQHELDNLRRRLDTCTSPEQIRRGSRSSGGTRMVVTMSGLHARQLDRSSQRAPSPLRVPPAAAPRPGLHHGHLPAVSRQAADDPSWPRPMRVVDDQHQRCRFARCTSIAATAAATSPGNRCPISSLSVPVSRMCRGSRHGRAGWLAPVVRRKHYPQRCQQAPPALITGLAAIKVIHSTRKLLAGRQDLD